MSVRGHTYEKQLFTNGMFRHFINIFTNKQTGVTKGCGLTQTDTTIKIGSGAFCIQGGFLEEDGGTELTIPSSAGYHILVYEIDLTKNNTKTEFNQGSYKFVSGIGDYSGLIQEDLDNGGNIYQFEFCRFRITEAGLQDFQDTRKFIDYGIFLNKADMCSIKAYQARDQIANQNQNCRLDESVAEGDAFTLENNAIKVGKGVNYINVYAQIFFQYLDLQQNYFWIRVQKNGSTIAQKLTNYGKGENAGSFCVADVQENMIAVEEGDLITLNFGDIADKQPTTRSGYFNTFLTVTAVK